MPDAIAVGGGPADLLAYPTAEVCQTRAVEAAPDGRGGFEVATEAGRFTARRLVLATGGGLQLIQVAAGGGAVAGVACASSLSDGWSRPGDPVGCWRSWGGAAG
jgi:thioredoxin reductase